MSGVEERFRERIFQALEERMRFGNGTITSRELSAFPVGDQVVPLVGTRVGIWNPRWLSSTLSIMSSAEGPYSDEEVSPGVWRYDYQRGTEHGRNTKLRIAYETKTPVILLRRIKSGVFVPHFPVFVSDDNRIERFFILTDPDVLRLSGNPDPDLRGYIERSVMQRVHQKEFRGKVLLAYSDKCAVCRLSHPELLDAAHILPDKHERGFPIVPNGISLCKIHHSAYDTDLMGIDPDYTVYINRDLLEERDGPMLKHGLQEMHGSKLVLPRSRVNQPDRENLAERFARFSEAS